MGTITSIKQSINPVRIITHRTQDGRRLRALRHPREPHRGPRQAGAVRPIGLLDINHTMRDESCRIRTTQLSEAVRLSPCRGLSIPIDGRPSPPSPPIDHPPQPPPPHPTSPPPHLLTTQGTKELTCVSNNAGVDNFGLGLLLKTRQVGGWMGDM